jgi:hypothetical protein
VTVHECAVTDRDGEFELHTSVDVDGRPVSFGHTLLDRAGTEEIAWSGSVSVIGRSLASLVNGGELPKQVGILKIDTEGSDLAVVTGMGPLECDVVMVEHWTYLPNSLGRCPWTIEEMHSALRPRGFSHFALIAHEQPFVILKWDDAELPVGHMGNLVFLHDKVLDQLLPEIVSCASSLAEDAVRTGQMYVDEAGKRLVVIEELERACQAYAERIDELERNLIHRLVKATRRSRSH